jgi:hypothetical protein
MWTVLRISSQPGCSQRTSRRCSRAAVTVSRLQAPHPRWSRTGRLPLLPAFPVLQAPVHPGVPSACEAGSGFPVRRFLGILGPHSASVATPLHVQTDQPSSVFAWRDVLIYSRSFRLPTFPSGSLGFGFIFSPTPLLTFGCQGRELLCRRAHIDVASVKHLGNIGARGLWWCGRRGLPQGRHAGWRLLRR